METAGNGAGGRPPLDAFLAESRAKAAQGSPVELSVRDLLRYFGAERRGVRVVNQIEKALDSHGLASQPPFTAVWIDQRIQLPLATPLAPTEEAGQGTAMADHGGSQAETSLTVSRLESASSGVASIQRNADLGLARALMLRYDYSQLAVMAGDRRLVGAVSWQSMAIAALCGGDFTLADATMKANPVESDHDLISLIPTITEQGFVFVIGSDRKLAGIVTTADLSDQFATLAKPFLLLGEIERLLRRTLSTRFQPAELAQAVDPDDSSRTVESVSDLSLGEIGRIVEQDGNWTRLSWPVDRAEFVKAFHEVREIRNDVMHFSPDPPTAEQEATLINFMNWLKIMDRIRTP